MTNSYNTYLHKKEQNRKHLINLIKVALADEIIDSSEKELLLKIGKEKGHTEEEIENLIEITKAEMSQPELDLSDRFHQMYEIMQMVLTDGLIDSSEMRLATSIAIKLGFNENEISPLLTILMQGIKKSQTEVNIFKNYKENQNINYI